MFVIEVIVLALIGLLGIGWQIELFEKDCDNHFEYGEPPLRVAIPLILGAITLFGIVIHGLIAIYGDERSQLNWSILFSNLGKVLVLYLSFSLKSLFAPIFTAFTLIMVTYFLFEYGEFRIFNFVRVILNWFFSALPNWVETLYVGTLFIVATGGALGDTFEWFE